MVCTFRPALFFVILGFFLSWSRADAQESPLAQIPAKAPVVIAIHGMKRTTDRLTTLVKNVVPDQAKGVQASIENLLIKSPFAGRQIKGLPDEGPIFVVLHSLPKLDKLAESQVGIIARVADYRTFRDGFLSSEERKSLAEDKANGWEVAALGTGQVFFIPRKDYAVICFHRSAAVEFAKKEKVVGLEGTLPAALAKKMLDSDLAIYVDWAAVNKQYDPLIKAGKLALAGLLVGDGEENEKLDKAQAEMIKGIQDTVLQLADDTSYFFFSCDFQPKGLAVHFAAVPASGTKTDQVFATLKPSALYGLESLPAGFTTYTGADCGLEGVKAFRPLVKTMLAPSGERGDEAADRILADAFDELFDARPREMYSAAKLGAGLAAIQVWRLENPAKGVAAQLRMFRALKEGGSFHLVPVKSKPVVKADAQPYRDAKLHRVSLKWDVEKLADSLLGTEDGSAMLKKFSGEKTTLWFGKVGKQNVQVLAESWKTAESYLDGYFKKEAGIGAGSKAFVETRGHLPREATLVTLIHAPRYGRYFAEILDESFKAMKVKKVKTPTVPEVKPPDSYVGIAVTLRAGMGSFDMWLPTAAAGELSRVIAPYLSENK